MKHPDTTSVKPRTHSCETYIDFLTKNLGASREEVLEVTRRSGISARRIAEFLVRQQSKTQALVPKQEIRSLYM